MSSKLQISKGWGTWSGHLSLLTGQRAITKPPPAHFLIFYNELNAGKSRCVCGNLTRNRLRFILWSITPINLQSTGNQIYKFVHKLINDEVQLLKMISSHRSLAWLTSSADCRCGLLADIYIMTKRILALFDVDGTLTDPRKVSLLFFTAANFSFICHYPYRSVPLYYHPPNKQTILAIPYDHLQYPDSFYMCLCMPYYEQEVEQKMVDELQKLRNIITIGIVGGSDLSKQLEQLGKNGTPQHPFLQYHSSAALCGWNHLSYSSEMKMNVVGWLILKHLYIFFPFPDCSADWFWLCL